MVKNSLKPEWILPIGGALSGRVCAYTIHCTLQIKKKCSIILFILNLVLGLEYLITELNKPAAQAVGYSLRSRLV